MEKYNLLNENIDLSIFAETKLALFPQGYLYNFKNRLNQDTDFFKIVKSLFCSFIDCYSQIEKAINDSFTIDEQNIFLDEYLKKYGLPNVIFSNLQNNIDKVFAINMMRSVNYISSKKDFEDFFSLLGLDVKLYQINEVFDGLDGFDYSFPITFDNSSGISGKNKLTYWVYVEENNSNLTNINNIGDAFNIEFGNSENNIVIVKKILDYIKPEVIKFIFIDKETKEIYGL